MNLLQRQETPDSGFSGWVIWIFLHIYRLIGFCNRLLVLINWAWD